MHASNTQKKSVGPEIFLGSIKLRRIINIFTKIKSCYTDYSQKEKFSQWIIYSVLLAAYCGRAKLLFMKEEPSQSFSCRCETLDIAQQDRRSKYFKCGEPPFCSHCGCLLRDCDSPVWPLWPDSPQ